MLYLVATPIGNLKDITIRAIETLNFVDIIACEDTRTSKVLLDHYNIKKPLVSYHKFNESKELDFFVEKLKSGSNIAYISDAGTPALSDPSKKLILRCIEENLDYTVLPGANALIPAFCMSLFEQEFIFLGFSPKKSRLEWYKKYENYTTPLVFYESKNRIVESLEDALKILGNRKISIIREISKIFEEKLHGNIEDIIKHFTTTSPKGEFVVVIEGKQREFISIKQAMIIAKDELNQGKRAKDISKELSKLCNIKSSILYKEILKL